MRNALLLISLAAMPLIGCATTTTSYVESNAALGRVVVYRNGIAYFERTAEVTGDELALSVPADKVDDFLKSLTVVDADTKQPAPIAYPTLPPSSETGLMSMKIQLKEPGVKGKPRKLLLSYVTEAPSWKPSYRIVLGENGKVAFEGWAIVDNTSGEDWKNVKLGVGSSSALSFRFDLHSVRNVARETLSPTEQFAIAPPTGGSVYANAPGVLDFVDDATLTLAENSYRGGFDKEEGGNLKRDESARKKPATKLQQKHGGKADAPDIDGQMRAPGDTRQTGGAMSAGEHRIQTLARRVQVQNQRVVVEGFAGKDDADKSGAALERANRLREQLIQNGVPPEQIDAVANTEIASATGGARVVEAQKQTTPQSDGKGKEAAGGGGSLEPIGTSHFESKATMSVARGTSAMVSILNTSTEGEVVYLYDPESARGNAQFAFKSVRLKNPTDSTLETGPVTVFGQGRFIGEGLTEPIPGKAASFVPFALDRQVVVESKDEENEAIAKILTVQRGVLSTEMRKVSKRTYVIQNRLGEEANVYVRHTVPKGFKLTKHPENVERFGEAHLFRVKVPAGGKIDVVIEEETPVFKSVDMRSAMGMDLVRAFVSSAALTGDVAGKLKGLLELQKDLGNTEQKIETQREQMGEYKARMDELHLQIVTLKAVKTGGSLMKNLEKKLDEVSDKLSKSTVDLVALEEQRMISRIKLQDGVAELSLDKKDDVKSPPSKVAGAN